MLCKRKLKRNHKKLPWQLQYHVQANGNSPIWRRWCYSVVNTRDAIVTNRGLRVTVFWKQTTVQVSTRWQLSNRWQYGMVCSEWPVDGINAWFVPEVTSALISAREFYITCRTASRAYNNPYPTAFPYGNGMVLHFYQQQESSTTKTVHKVINKGLKTYV